MFKLILALAGICSFLSANAQFAKVVDKDGYANVREQAHGQSKIIGKVNSNEIVYTFDPFDLASGWINMDYVKNEHIQFSGYMHTSRLKLIADFEEIPLAIAEEHDATFILRDIAVSIQSAPFDYESNKKLFSSTNYGDYTIEDKYKGKQVWGTDGTIPQTQYTSILITKGNSKIEIPREEFENLFNVNNDFANCYYDTDTDRIYITSVNSDGAGGYAVLFIIEKGKYSKKIVLMPF